MNDLDNRTKALEESVEELIDEIDDLQNRVIKLEVKNKNKRKNIGNIWAEVD